MAKRERTAQRENTQHLTQRAAGVIQRAVTENTGLTGRAARSLRDRQKEIDDAIEGRRRK